MRMIEHNLQGFLALNMISNKEDMTNLDHLPVMQEYLARKF